MSAFPYCCLGISIWGVIQLTLMGLFYSLEATTMIEDVEPEDFSYKDKDLEGFLKKIESNYHTVSNTCYYTAYVYIVMIIISCYLIHRGGKKAKIQEKMNSEEGVCGPNPVDSFRH